MVRKKKELNYGRQLWIPVFRFSDLFVLIKKNIDNLSSIEIRTD